MSDLPPVFIVGAGNMSLAYAKVLSHLGQDFQCLGRGVDSAARFEAETGIRPSTGPLADQLEARDLAGAHVIVAVNVPELESVCSALLKAGAGRILVEKPGGVDMAALERLGAADSERRLRIAYNRRFLPSVQKAAELIAQDGGAQVLSFEFTELSDRIKAANVHPPEVLAHWYLANSSHVFDLAFHVAGSAGDLSDVTTLAAAASGTLDWHPAGARFVGCGSFAGAGLFNYSADWQSGGGWGVEVTTSQRKLTLKPLERLSQQMRNTFDVTPVDIQSEPEGLKPGLLGLVQDFLSFDGAGCPDIQAHIARMKTFSAMIKSPV